MRSLSLAEKSLRIVTEGAGGKQEAAYEPSIAEPERRRFERTIATREQTLRHALAVHDDDHAAFEQEVRERAEEIAMLTKLLTGSLVNGQEIDSLQSYADDLDASLSERFLEIADLISFLVRLEHEMDASIAQAEGLRAALGENCRRLTWRLGAPFRSLWDALGGRRARFRRLLASSELFDRDWYLNSYPDVAESGKDPLDHIVAYGAKEGRDPSPKFSSKAYLEKYPDVDSAKASALEHYLLYGRIEGRQIHEYRSAPLSSLRKIRELESERI